MTGQNHVVQHEVAQLVKTVSHSPFVLAGRLNFEQGLGKVMKFLEVEPTKVRTKSKHDVQYSNWYE